MKRFNALPDAHKMIFKALAQDVNGTDIFYFDSIDYGLGKDLLALRLNYSARKISQVFVKLGREDFNYTVIALVCKRIYQLYAGRSELYNNPRDAEIMRSTFFGIKNDTLTEALHYSEMFKEEVLDKASF